MNLSRKELSYQTNAVNRAIEHLKYNNQFKLQAPTGSGKTFIIAQIIDKYLEDEQLNCKNTAFIFIAPSVGKLDYQGYEKISSYLRKDWVKGFSTEYIGTTNDKKSYLQNIECFHTNTVYFFGWAMFKKGTKITNMNSEKTDIYQIIYNTQMNNTNVVLIIDEAHREIKENNEFKTQKDNIINDLKPYKVIKVSATLKEVKEVPDHTITYDDVRAEEAIKQNVIISALNTKIKDIEKKCEEEQLIVSAIKKQEEIKNSYIKKKIDVNPLILIQIPDNVNIGEFKNEDLLLKKILEILYKHNYKEGCNLAVWLDKKKTTKDKNKITENKSQYEILIFKTAIATGWDIPRANILVRIREAKTKAFNIQTLGRILRNPFFKYYNNELIDNAFVFTKDENYKSYILKEGNDIVSDENETLEVERSEKAKNSKFSINKLIINQENYNVDEMYNHVWKEVIKHNDFKEFLKWKHPNTITDDMEIDACDALELNEDKFNKQKEKHFTQSKLSLNEPRITLFDLYIKYKTVTKSSDTVNKVLDKISMHVNKKHNVTIKHFYWACIYNWKKHSFKVNDKDSTLKELIEYEKNKFLKDYVKCSYEKYSLPEKYKISTNEYNKGKWDKINTFNACLIVEKLDSKKEEKFYEAIKNNYDDLDNKIHIFRNGTNPSSDYYLEYLNVDDKVLKFYPDFIVINEDKNICIIFEVKGLGNHDIDQNTNEKFKFFNDNIKKINMKNYENFKLYKVSFIDNELEFINEIDKDKRCKDFSEIKKEIEKYGNSK